jgi:hypothetical protein
MASQPHPGSIRWRTKGLFLGLGVRSAAPVAKEEGARRSEDDVLALPVERPFDPIGVMTVPTSR